MKIDEKIQEVKNELIKILTEFSDSREELMQMLEKIGLDRKIIDNLIESFIQAENAKNAVKNVWESDTRIDSSIDIATYQQQEIETRKKFDDIIEASSILIILNKTNINELNEKLGQKLYVQGIDESQITRPVLRKSYHDYVERVERENHPETLRLKELISRLGKYAAKSKEKCGELEKKNEDLKAENERLKKENEALKRSNDFVKAKFKTRIISDENNYQAALTQIKTLKRELRKAQNRGVIQTLGAKLFGNRQKELPEPAVELPISLYEGIVEEFEAKGYDKRNVETNKQVSKKERINKDEELEK